MAIEPLISVRPGDANHLFQVRVKNAGVAQWNIVISITERAKDCHMLSGPNYMNVYALDLEQAFDFVAIIEHEIAKEAKHK